MLRTRFSPPLKPAPTIAYYRTADNFFRVHFTSLLKPDALDPTNWTFRVAGTSKRATTATAVSNTVQGTTANFPAGPANDTCKYNPPPADVVRRYSGETADSFTDFPLTYL